MTQLVFLDKELTLWLNSFYNEFFDIFFYLYTSTLIWVPLYVVMAWMIFSRQGVRGVATLFFIGLLILAADQLASGLLKPMVERLRPSHDGVLQYMVHLVNDRRGGSFGFASSHAANTFALATFLSLVVRNRFMGFSLFVWALANSYSRVYAGLHFVGDILAGAIIGLVLGAVFYQLYLRAVLHFFVISHHNKRTLKSGLAEMFGRGAPYVVGASFWLMVLVLVIVTKLMLGYHGAAV